MGKWLDYRNDAADRDAVVLAEAVNGVVQITLGELVFPSEHIVRPRRVSRFTVEDAKAFRDELDGVIESLEDSEKDPV